MKWDAGKSFEQAPPGSQIGRCYAVVDLGTQRHTYKDKEGFSRDVRLSFELPLKKMVGKFDPEDKGRIFSVHMTVKQSLHPKATLRKMLEGWRGKKFKDKAETDAFDPKKLLGLPCRLNLIQNEEYTNIDSIAPLDKDELKKVPKQVNASVFFDLEAFDEAVFDTLSERTQEKIKATPEYMKLAGGEPAGDPSTPTTDDPPPGDPPGDADCPF
jgi:hypothetical protein